MGVLAVAGGAGLVLWWPATRGLNGAELVAARLDAVKTALSIALGGGGVFALFLGWRRQRATEADLDNRERALAHQLQVAADTKAHQERVALNTEADAEAKRITDLFTKAVEQLGSDKAPVRLGGLYALGRLGQDNPDQRQTVVDVICAYLRMPYVPSYGIESGAVDPETETAVLELQVRLTAQRILQRHLRHKSTTVQASDGFAVSPTYWPDIDLDLRLSALVDFDLSFCKVRRAQFYGATFHRPAEFVLAQFDYCSFQGARFTGYTEFGGAVMQAADFAAAKFEDRAHFHNVEFRYTASFYRAMFDMTADFTEAKLPETATFHEAIFAAGVPVEVEPYYQPREDC